MTNVNVNATELYPQAGTNSSGQKIYYISATAKAAEGDTITIKNVNAVDNADLKLASITQENINITDSDTAASAGVAVYVHTKDGEDAWLEFVSPTNADGTGTLNDGGSSYFIFDSNAAATDGIPVYFDEDGTNANERLLIVSPTGEDLFLTLENGKKIRLTHDADAASNGIQVYFDEDGSNAYERLLFVSPSDADGTAQTETVEEVGDYEPHTISGNIITLNGERIGTVKGQVIAR